MDRSQISQGLTPERYACQVCGFEPSEAQKACEKRWVVYTFTKLEEGSYNIVVCPKCQNLSADAIVHGYQTRIQTGYDLKYH